MEASSFEKSVCLQFNALMMIVIKGTLSSHRRQVQDVLNMKSCFVNCLK